MKYYFTMEEVAMIVARTIPNIKNFRYNFKMTPKPDGNHELELFIEKRD